MWQAQEATCPLSFGNEATRNSFILLQNNPSLYFLSIFWFPQHTHIYYCLVRLGCVCSGGFTSSTCYPCRTPSFLHTVWWRTACRGTLLWLLWSQACCVETERCEKAGIVPPWKFLICGFKLFVSEGESLLVVYLFGFLLKFILTIHHFDLRKAAQCIKHTQRNIVMGCITCDSCRGGQLLVYILPYFVIGLRTACRSKNPKNISHDHHTFLYSQTTGSFSLFTDAREGSF